MITLQLERHSDGRMTSQSSREETPAQALSFLVQSELAFNAQVIELTPEHIHLETRLTGILDITHLRGNADEMRQLVELVAIYQSTADFDGIVTGGAAEDFVRLTAGRPAYSGHVMNLGAPMFVGRSRLRVAVMLALGYRNEADLTAAAALSLSDLMTVFELMAEHPETSFNEMLVVLGLATASSPQT